MVPTRRHFVRNEAHDLNTEGSEVVCSTSNVLFQQSLEPGRPGKNWCTTLVLAVFVAAVSARSQHRRRGFLFWLAQRRWSWRWRWAWRWRWTKRERRVRVLLDCAAGINHNFMRLASWRVRRGVGWLPGVREGRRHWSASGQLGFGAGATRGVPLAARSEQPSWYASWWSSNVLGASPTFQADLHRMRMLWNQGTATLYRAS